MSDKVAKAFEEFLRTRRDHRDGLSARQQLWTAFEAGAQFTLDEIRERTGLTAPTPETVAAPEASLVKTLERSPRRIGTGHGDNCPCWDCTRDQFGI